MLRTNISLTRPHYMVNFGPQAADIDPVIWGTHANFNGFRVLAALLHGTRLLGIRHQPNFAALNRGRHLYSAGRPSRWSLAHISSCKKEIYLIELSCLLLTYLLPCLLTYLLICTCLHSCVLQVYLQEKSLHLAGDCMQYHAYIQEYTYLPKFTCNVIVSDVIPHLRTRNFHADFGKRCLFDLARNTQKHFPELKNTKTVFLKKERGLRKSPPLGQQRVNGKFQ